MTAVDLSSYAGLAAMFLLTLNILLGLLLSTRYTPVLRWPHRKIKIFEIHNWTAYIALSLVFLHPILLLSSSTAGFKILDVLWPVHSPGQRLYNWFGACAFYVVTFVVVTSYFRPRLGSRLWKAFHYAAYAAAGLLYVHGILIDQNLKNLPSDYLDGEKVEIEACCGLVLAGSLWRLRYGLRKTRLVASGTSIAQSRAE
jgi:sulfoxide reductase heme-binding subunit YedZ